MTFITTSNQKRTSLFMGCILLFAVTLGGCGIGVAEAESNSSQIGDELASSKPFALFTANREGLATSGSLDIKIAAEDSEEPKDYWASVPFTRANFD